jgi:acyl carrier protein
MIKQVSPRTYHEIVHWLTARISREISISPDAIRPDEPLSYYGLDSVQVLTLVGELEDFLGTRLHPSIAWEYPTIALLADHAARSMGISNELHHSMARTTEAFSPMKNALSARTR